jgi:V8-like Glu-specific endopeptidase
MAGSAFCVVKDKYVLTAQHILNGGKVRNLNDKFFAIVVPQNGDPAYHIPIISFPLERQDLDMAVLKLGACTESGIHMTALPVSFNSYPDGTPVITVGFPSPELTQVNVDAAGDYQGGKMFLKSHANTGIISAQYSMGQVLHYELNVGWHHGESGGPIVTASDNPAVFSLMQHYRNVKTPHGVVAGPHRGVSLSLIQQDLVNLGVSVV